MEIDETKLRTIVREGVEEALLERMMTAAETCRLLKCNYRTLQRMVERGEINARVMAGETKYLRSEVLQAGRIKFKRS